MTCYQQYVEFRTVGQYANLMNVSDHSEQGHLSSVFTVLRGKNAVECHSELVEAIRNNALPYRTVARWIGKFQQGRVSTSDEQRLGRPVCGPTWHVPSSSSWITLRVYSTRTATAGSDVVQSERPIFDDFSQHLWPYIGNNTANVLFQMVKRLRLIRIDQ
ncbi:HTH_48 domain-containing protein [Trichonephila clavipes]|nr:HTH_48 domain-containing protein [Trichonephila clavipes]